MSKIYRYIVAGVITAVVLFLVWYFSNVVAYILTAAVLAMIGKPLTDLLGMPSDVLPLALLRPVSGSGSIALVTDILKNHGPDSLEGKIASVMMGSTETTFYTVAVYFGAVGIKQLRHTVKSALLADFTGMLLAVYIARLLIG